MNVLPLATTADWTHRAPVAVLPVGSCEQHGPHLPLVTDTLIAAAIAQGIVDRYGLALLPALTYSCSHEHAAFAGTISLSATTLAAVIGDVATSLHADRDQALLIVNGHGGNYVLANIAQEANVDRPRIGLYPTRDDWQAARTTAGMTSSAHDDMHAGELETSILLAVHPGAVAAGWEQHDHVHDDRKHLALLGIDAFTPTGVIGQPSLATAEKGQAALDTLVESAGEVVKMLISNLDKP